MAELKVIENEIVPVYETEKGIKVVNGRELHEVLESKQDFSTWVKRRLAECDAEENEDFELLHNSVEQVSGTKYRIDYIIKLDTAKEMAMQCWRELGIALAIKCKFLSWLMWIHILLYICGYKS
mgnify:CR=1 FL=1